MQETAEQVATVHPVRPILGEGGDPSGRIPWLQPQRPVRVVLVVVRHVDAKDLVQLPAPDQQPVQALGANGSNSVGCVNAFMQLIDTREPVHQGGRVGAPGFGRARWAIVSQARA
jgi:hypothetical protein